MNIIKDVSLDLSEFVLPNLNFDVSARILDADSASVSPIDDIRMVETYINLFVRPALLKKIKDLCEDISLDGTVHEWVMEDSNVDKN